MVPGVKCAPEHQETHELLAMLAVSSRSDMQYEMERAAHLALGMIFQNGTPYLAWHGLVDEDVDAIISNVGISAPWRADAWAEAFAVVRRQNNNAGCDYGLLVALAAGEQRWAEKGGIGSLMQLFRLLGIEQAPLHHPSTPANLSTHLAPPPPQKPMRRKNPVAIREAFKRVERWTKHVDLFNKARLQP